MDVLENFISLELYKNSILTLNCIFGVLKIAKKYVWCHIQIKANPCYAFFEHVSLFFLVVSSRNAVKRKQCTKTNEKKKQKSYFFVNRHSFQLVHSCTQYFGSSSLTPLFFVGGQKGITKFKIPNNFVYIP